MDIDQLINKYIDGELSSSEDAALREMIAVDTDLKARFDAAVETQYRIAKDADSVKVPDNLYKKSEEAVLARILGKSAELDEEKRRKVIPFYIRWAGYAAAAGITLFTFIFGTDFFIETTESQQKNYLEYGEYGSYSTPERVNPLVNSTIEIPQEMIGLNQQQASSNSFSSSVSSAINSTVRDLSEVGSSNSETTTRSSGELRGSGDSKSGNSKSGSQSASNLDSGSDEERTFTIIKRTAKVELSIKPEILGENSDPAGLNENSDEEIEVYPEYKNSNSVNTLSQITKQGRAVGQPEIVANSELQNAYLNATTKQSFIISSNMTSDLQSYNTGMNDEPISSLSFSLGYMLTDHSVIGLELGNSLIALGGTEMRTTLSDPNDPTSTPLTVAVPVIYTLNQAWGTAFYEFRYNVIEDLYFSPRIGFGAGEGSVIGYTRATFVYSLFEGIGMRIGAEYRGMGLLGDGNPVPYYGTTAFTYGLDYSF